ncbi:MAG: tRNA pseudouridine(55) synthase TruB [Candidatus Binatales bacterium]
MLHGIILIDKPAGITSSEVVRRIKAVVKPARVGHLGTLDPFATGLLPIMIGEGTRLAPFLEGGAKQYQGVIRLGAETDTLDRDGVVIRSAAIPALDRARLDELAARFTGTIEQVPPIFSALKRGGVRLYDLARRGGEVAPPPPRRVEIRMLTLEVDGAAALRFTVECSTGTYIRSLARDIGVALGSAAHLAELRRIRSGSFLIEDAHPLEQALASLGGAAGAGLIAMRDALADLRELEVDSDLERRIRHGDSSALGAIGIPAGATLFKVLYGGRLLAIASAEPPAGARLIRVFGRET